MAAYQIHLINNFSTLARSQDYAFFNELPRLSHNPSCSPIHTNVIKSTCLRGGNTWSVGLSATLFAWCGTSDKQLSQSSRTNITSSKLVALGTSSSPGSTLQIHETVNGPRFNALMAATSTNGAACFQTNIDLDRSANVAYGLATVDDEGTFKPLFSMTAAGNALVNVQPSNNFYIAATSCCTGSFIDSIDAAPAAAKLNFSDHKDCFGAIITHCRDGSFKVQYASAIEFSTTIERETASSTAEDEQSLTHQLHLRDTELIDLKKQLKQMEDLVSTLRKAQEVTSTAFPPLEDSMTPLASSPSLSSYSPPRSVTCDSYPAKRQSAWYEATFTFQNKPSQSRRQDLRDRLVNYMHTLGYTYEGGSIDQKFVAIWSHDAGSYGSWHSTQQAEQDLRNVCQALPRHLKSFINSADVLMNRTAEAKGLWRARGETVTRVYGVEAKASCERLSSGTSTSDLSDASSEHRAQANGRSGHIPDIKRAKKGSKTAANGESGRNTGKGALSGGAVLSPLANGAVRCDSSIKPASNGGFIDATKKRAEAVFHAQDATTGLVTVR